MRMRDEGRYHFWPKPILARSFLARFGLPKWPNEVTTLGPAHPLTIQNFMVTARKRKKTEKKK